MPLSGQVSEAAARKRVVRRYRALGYDVQEDPGPDRLPDFMQDTSPDIVARSARDNVVIEIKRPASLKGSNDIIGLAERVSSHPDWRFELVVLGEERRAEVSTEAEFAGIVDLVEIAVNGGQFEIAYVYLAGVLVQIARSIGRADRPALTAGDDRAIIGELGFRGILPGSVVERSLDALAWRNRLAHGAQEIAPTRDDVEGLLALCRAMRAYG